MKLSEIMRAVISMARAADQARAAAGPEDDSPILTSGGVQTSGRDASLMRLRTTAEERRLREFLEAQPPPVIYMLTALMYLGRGDFDAKRLPDHYTDVSETFGDPKWAARQMLGMMPLPDYLEEGLKKLAHAGLNVDRLLPG